MDALQFLIGNGLFAMHSTHLARCSIKADDHGLITIITLRNIRDNKLLCFCRLIQKRLIAVTTFLFDEIFAFLAHPSCLKP